MNGLRAHVISVAWALGAAGALCGCSDLTYVSLGRNTKASASDLDAGATVTGDADDGEPSFTPLEPPPRCSGFVPSVAIESSCEARTSVTCQPATPTESALDVTLGALLESCGERDNLLHVRFGARGCAASFELLFGEFAPGTSDCLRDGLATSRYPCADAGSCGAGSVVHVPID